jgi:hypothetical protein
MWFWAHRRSPPSLGRCSSSLALPLGVSLRRREREREGGMGGFGRRTHHDTTPPHGPTKTDTNRRAARGRQTGRRVHITGRRAAFHRRISGTTEDATRLRLNPHRQTNETNGGSSERTALRGPQHWRLVLVPRPVAPTTITTTPTTTQTTTTTPTTTTTTTTTTTRRRAPTLRGTHRLPGCETGSSGRKSEDARPRDDGDDDGGGDDDDDDDDNCKQGPQRTKD